MTTSTIGCNCSIGSLLTLGYLFECQLHIGQRKAVAQLQVRYGLLQVLWLGLQAGNHRTGIPGCIKALALQQHGSIATHQLEVELAVLVAVLLESGTRLLGGRLGGSSRAGGRQWPQANGST